MDAEVWVAIIGAGASLIGAGVAWVKAHKLENLKAQIARDAAEHAAGLRVASERQLEVFKLAASSAEGAASILVDWLEALNDFSHDTFSRGHASWNDNLAVINPLRMAAEKAGLFVAPQLDEPFLAARAALRAATKAVSRHCVGKSIPGGNDEKTIDAHYRGLEKAEAAVGQFLTDVRAWKQGEWPVGTAKLTTQQADSVKRLMADEPSALLLEAAERLELAKHARKESAKHGK